MEELVVDSALGDAAQDPGRVQQGSADSTLPPGPSAGHAWRPTIDNSDLPNAPAGGRHRRFSAGATAQPAGRSAAAEREYRNSVEDRPILPATASGGTAGGSGAAGGLQVVTRERASVGASVGGADGKAVGVHAIWADSGAAAPRGIHVLLAEDNRVNQKVATAVLSRCGCAVTVANDGMEALLLIKEGHSYDIVFMCGFILPQP